MRYAPTNTKWDRLVFDANTDYVVQVNRMFGMAKTVLKCHASHINVFSVFVARLVENHFHELNISNDNSSSTTLIICRFNFFIYIYSLWFNYQNILFICMQIGKIAIFVIFVFYLFGCIGNRIYDSFEWM